MPFVRETGENGVDASMLLQGAHICALGGFALFAQSVAGGSMHVRNPGRVRVLAVQVLCVRIHVQDDTVRVPTGGNASSERILEGYNGHPVARN